MPFPDSKSTAWEFFTDDYLRNSRNIGAKETGSSTILAATAESQ
jgi:hypothetical protein